MEVAKYNFPLTFFKVGVIPKEIFLSGLYWVIFCADCIENCFFMGFASVS